jgi:fructose-bisphosphate aldolase, class II
MRRRDRRLPTLGAVVTGDTGSIVSAARTAGKVVLAFNVPYLPMIRPVIAAVADADAFALIEVARLEWCKFESGGPAQVMAEFERWHRPEHVRLHLDHVPVVDEDGHGVDYEPILRNAIALGYGSVMLDGSRLPLDANIAATRRVVQIAHAAGIACEAELGAVLGHESGPPPDYDTLFATGRGFTAVADAGQFVHDTGCDWLSVAVGNIHGAVTGVLRHGAKPEARLDLDRVEALSLATGTPLVLHGGSGIRHQHVLEAVGRGIGKINIGTEIRQAYEAALPEGVTAAQRAVAKKTGTILAAYGRLVMPAVAAT